MNPSKKEWVIGLVVILSVTVSTLWWWQRNPPEPSSPPTISVADVPGVVGSPGEHLEEPAAVTPQPGIQLRFSPTRNQVGVWRFDSQSQAAVDFVFMQPKVPGAGGPTSPRKTDQRIPVRSTMHGELYLKFYPREPGIWNVAGLIQNFDFRINGEKPVYERALGEPFVCSMDSQGRFVEFRFTRGIPDQAKDLVRNMLLGMQIILPKEEYRTWSSIETDLTGRYRADYQIRRLNARDKTVTLDKEKKNYLSLNRNFTSAPSAIADSSARIAHSRGTLTMAIKGPWITSMEYKEKIILAAEGYEWSEAESETRLTLIERDATGLFPDTFGTFAARLHTDSYLQTKYYTTDASLDQLGAGLTMDGAVELFKKISQSKESSDKRAAERFMVNYLRKHPGSCTELIDLMNQDPHRERLDESTQLIFWRLLTTAGHGEAQEAVLNSLLDSNRSEVTRMRALTSIHNFEYPQPFLVDGLYRYHERSAQSSADPRDTQMGTMALFAIGALGYKVKLNEETQTKVGQLLATHIGKSKTPADQIQALTAVGNYGGKELIPKVEPFLSSTNARVRASAYGAMRRMDDPTAFNTIVKHYEQETTPAVRTAALKAIAEFTPRSEELKWVNHNALAVQHPAEQVVMAQILGETGKDNPENVQTLRKMLKNNPDIRVKREIYKYIAPGP
ncbi:MAG: HEAT repeat domain-containing protein [Magnetococcales bacterium]|nr:HEAT repeat domain-containing protein [Magnetococcales bacterium]